MSEANPEISLNDVAWLTALARTLTRDEAEADDLVQDTWVAARTSPPRSGGVNRPWLATALRRFHLQSLRANRRRVRRGQAAARHEALPDTAELVERTELQRTLADCLISLEEPYRTTLMLVTFEDVSTAEIAERDGVSVSVVRYRVRKAREMMRAKLMATNGEDWSQWHAALLPFASLPFPGKAAALTAAAASHVAPKSAWFGVLAMSVKLMVILSPLVAVLAALYLVRPTPTDDLSVVERSVQSDPGATVAALPSELASQTVRVAGSGAPEIPSANSASEAPGIAQEEERPAHASDPQLATLEMRIRSPHGGWSAGLMADEAPFLDGTRPRWNAAELEDERPRQITGAWGKGRAVGAHSDRRKDGVYKWVNVRPGIPLTVAALDCMFLPVETISVPPLMPGEDRVVDIVVLKTPKTLELRILSSSGEPIPNASVVLSETGGARVTGGTVLRDGVYRRTGLGLDEVTVRVEAEGFATWIDAAFPVADTPVDVILERGRTVRVEVRTPTLEAVRGADVICKLPGRGRNLRFSKSVKSDEKGVSVLSALPMDDVPIEVTVDGYVFTDTLPGGALMHTVEIPARQELQVLVIGEPSTALPGRDLIRLRPLPPTVGPAEFRGRASLLGRYVFDGVFPGEYEVALVRLNRDEVVWTSETVEVSITDTRPAEVTLEL